MCNLPFTALYFAVNCFVFFWFNTRQYLFKRCNSLMSSISSNFFLYFCKKIFLIKSSLGQNILRIISPDSSMKSQDIGSMALLGHEAEYHYHSLEPVVSTRSSQSAVDFLIDRYGEGKITEEYCSECGKKYQSVSSGIHVSERGCVRYYCDDQTGCDLCQYMKTHPDVME